MSDPYDPNYMPRGVPQRPESTPSRGHGEELLIRIDERTQQLAAEMKSLKEVVVSRAEFAPVRLVTYGLVGLILTLVITAMAATLIVK